MPGATCAKASSRAGKQGQPVKNFERWLYQRDADGARTLATEKVEVPPQMFEFDRNHLYDLTARQTQMAKGQSLIRFGLDEAFLAGGPHAVAVKITYLDRANAEWQLEYFTDAKKTATRQSDLRRLGRGQDHYVHSQRRLLSRPGLHRFGFADSRAEGRRGHPLRAGDQVEFLKCESGNKMKKTIIAGLFMLGSLLAPAATVVDLEFESLRRCGSGAGD